MYKYEYSFIAHQGLLESEVKSLMSNLVSTLVNNGAQVLKKEYWGLLDLAYIINNQKKGHYFLLCIEATLEVLSEFQRKLKLNELIMRYLQLRIDEVPEGDSLIMDYINEERK